MDSMLSLEVSKLRVSKSPSQSDSPSRSIGPSSSTDTNVDHSQGGRSMLLFAFDSPIGCWDETPSQALEEKLIEVIPDELKSILFVQGSLFCMGLSAECTMFKQGLKRGFLKGCSKTADRSSAETSSLSAFLFHLASPILAHCCMPPHSAHHRIRYSSALYHGHQGRFYTKEGLNPSFDSRYVKCVSTHAVIKHA